VVQGWFAHAHNSCFAVLGSIKPNRIRVEIVCVDAIVPSGTQYICLTPGVSMVVPTYISPNHGLHPTRLSSIFFIVVGPEIQKQGLASLFVLEMDENTRSHWSSGKDPREDVDNTVVKENEEIKQVDGLPIASEDMKGRTKDKDDFNIIVNPVNEVGLWAYGSLESYSEDSPSACCVCNGETTVETLLFDYELLLARLDATEAENFERMQQLADVKARLEHFQAGKDRLAAQLGETKALLLHVHAENVLLKRIIEVEKGSKWLCHKKESKPIVLSESGEDDSDE